MGDRRERLNNSLIYSFMAKRKNNIVIPRKAMYGIAPAIAIIAVLLSKDKVGPMVLFLIGIFVGVMIARGYLLK